MLKKLVPALLGALLIASPVIAVTTAAAQGTMQSAPAPAKSTQKAATHKTWAKHKKASHHAMKMKKHAKKKDAPKA